MIKFFVPGKAASAGSKRAFRTKGGKIRGNRLDVFFGDHDEAIKFGVQWLKVKQVGKDG